MVFLRHIDLILVSIFLFICFNIGTRQSYGVKSLRQFALGYKDVTITMLTCTIFASAIGSGATIVTVKQIYSLGIIFAIAQTVKPLRWFITSKIFANNIERFRGCLSISHIMSRLYGKPGRFITSIAAVVCCLAIVATQAVAIGELFHYFFKINRNYGILISCGIFTLYSTLGGIRAIVPTEIFKFVVFLIVLPISYTLIAHEGGFSEVITPNLPESHLHFVMNKDNILLLIGYIFTAILPEYKAPFIQRCLLADNYKQLKHSLNLVMFLYVTFCVSMCFIAYVVKAYFPDIMPSEALFYFIDKLMPIGLKGLMIAGLMAVMMSMAEAQLSATGVIIVNDLIKPLLPNKLSKETQLLLVRASTMLLSIPSILFALSGKGVSEIAWIAFNFWDPLILMPIAAGFLGFKTNSKSFIASVVLGLSSVLMVKMITGELSTLSLITGIIASSIGLFGSHYMQSFIGKVPLSEQLNLSRYNMKPKTVLTRAYSFVASQFVDKNIQIYKFCTFTFAYFFLCSINVDSRLGYNYLGYLLIAGYMLCMIFAFRTFIFSKSILDKYLPVFYNILVIYCLPFVSSYILLISHNEPFWITTCIMAIVALFYILNITRFFLFSIIGVGFGYTFFALTNANASASLIMSSSTSAIYIASLITFMVLFFVKSKEKEHGEREENLLLLGGAIAHEVKSPIAAMKMCSENVNQVLGDLLESAKLEGDHYILKVDQIEYDFLKDLNGSLQKLGLQSIDTVDTILTSLKSSVVAADKKAYKASLMVSEAISQYIPFNSRAENIKLNIIKDFEIFCSKQYLKHIITNLIKNAYKHGGTNVEIVITLDNNQIQFKDFGKGIAKANLPFIFDRFFTKSQTGTGIGLAFCKMVMDDLDGSIECKSVLSKYTTFILNFPAIHMPINLSLDMNVVIN